MTDTEINIAIAKSCGWSRFGDPYPNHENSREVPLPDYCYDLNAMHEAESILDASQLDYMTDVLSKIYGDLAISAKPLWRATARQRAEAFLRVKGLWKEESDANH